VTPRPTAAGEEGGFDRKKTSQFPKSSTGKDISVSKTDSCVEICPEVCNQNVDQMEERN